jgi:diguanylate cyclase (GGDEF)-like protein
LREVGPAGIAFCWLVEAVAITAVVTSAGPLTGYDIARATLLAAVAIVHAEAARTVGRVRQVTITHVDLNSTWTFAAALVLPLPLAAAVIVAIYTHAWFRVRRTPPFRRVFSIAMYILAAAAASTVFRSGHVFERLGTATIAILAAAIAYTTVNVALPAMSLLLVHQGRSPLRTAIGTPADNALKGATLCLGVFVAIAMDQNPILVIVGLPLILVLHRNEMVHQIEEMARTDRKTGLLNATTWADKARAEIGRAPRRAATVGVLLLDLDLFKKVNDTYGHLAGDDVLRSVAAVLKAEVRAADSVGRFGGEEFVVLLPDITSAQVVRAAERIRRRIEDLVVTAGKGDAQQTIDNLSVSIGAAAFPTHGQDVDQLMEAADKALYRAKSNGRNQTQLAS